MNVIKKVIKFVFDVISASRKDSVGAYSANAAFFVTVSFIPFIMLLISMLKFLPLGTKEMVEQLAAIFPSGARDIASTVVTEAFSKSGTALISITAVSSLWTASIGVHSLVKGLDRIYSANEAKSLIMLRLKSTFYTILVLIVIILCLGIFVFGDTITDSLIREFPWTKGIIAVIISGRKLVAGVMLSAFFLTMYTIVPTRKVRLPAQIPGAVISGLGWVAVSQVFTYYYENLFDYSYLYGGLSLLVFFMLWLLVCMYILFVGAEINKCLQDRIESALLFK